MPRNRSSEKPDGQGRPRADAHPPPMPLASEPASTPRARPNEPERDDVQAQEGQIAERIAGVKLPKATRKGPIADFLNSSGGQVLSPKQWCWLPACLERAASPRRQARRGTPECASTLQMPRRVWRMRPVALQAFRAALSEPSPLLDEISDTDDTSSENGGVCTG